LTDPDVVRRRNEELEDLMKENQDRLETFETNNQVFFFIPLKPRVE